MRPKVDCDKLTFSECELAILRASADKATEKINRRVVANPETKEIIGIVQKFLRDKRLIAYGGQAINEELPAKDRFYNDDVDLPDYDFYSPHALPDAKALADIYFNAGYTEVEAKSGQHHGTYKVFVNFMPIADISQLPQSLFDVLKRDAIESAGILYAPPNFLRMGMYLELSRPAGDTSRWEKVQKRLTLLNNAYPMPACKNKKANIQRTMSKGKQEALIHDTIRDAVVDIGGVFFGGYGLSLYSRYMPRAARHETQKISDFDVLVNDPKRAAKTIIEALHQSGITGAKARIRPAIGEIVPEQHEISVDGDIVCVLYKPVACHSFNTIPGVGAKIRVATIDTMLAFYLAFLFADKAYYDTERIMCMATFLFNVQQRNRLEQKGLLRRFTITCYGHQESVEEMRAERSRAYKRLKKGTPEYEEWFLNYKPGAPKKAATPRANVGEASDSDSDSDSVSDVSSNRERSGDISSTMSYKERPKRKTRRRKRDGFFGLFKTKRRQKRRGFFTRRRRP